MSLPHSAEKNQFVDAVRVLKLTQEPENGGKAPDGAEGNNEAGSK